MHLVKLLLFKYMCIWFVKNVTFSLILRLYIYIYTKIKPVNIHMFDNIYNLYTNKYYRYVKD